MRSYRRLQNMVALANAVAFFTAVVMGTRMKLEIHATPLINASKRLFGIPDFRYYTIADGIREVCVRSPAVRPAPSRGSPTRLRLPLNFWGGSCWFPAIDRPSCAGYLGVQRP